jgi:hypothetical protein
VGGWGGGGREVGFWCCVAWREGLVCVCVGGGGRGLGCVGRGGVHQEGPEVARAQWGGRHVLPSARALLLLLLLAGGGGGGRDRGLCCVGGCWRR